MKVQIEINCDSNEEVYMHLECLQSQLRKFCDKKKLTLNNELPLGTRLTDNNCYGSHELTVVSEEE